jgi:TatD DNase family protein
MLTDVHAHLGHRKMTGDLDQILARAADAGVTRIITNGLEPVSNRTALEMSAIHPAVKAALGIYPLDAANEWIANWEWPFEFAAPARFDVDEEIRFIESVADRIVAVGECGLDGHWVPESVPAQIDVLKKMCDLAIRIDRPIILHSRKAERETFDVVRESGVRRAIFHCFMGKKKLAQEIAKSGYFLSVPPIVERTESFQRMVDALPREQLLVETDSPYLSADKGTENEPAQAARSARWMAEYWGETEESAFSILAENTNRLFGDLLDD